MREGSESSFSTCWGSVLGKGLPLPYQVLSLCSCPQMQIYGWIEVLAPKLNDEVEVHMVLVLGVAVEDL